MQRDLNFSKYELQNNNKQKMPLMKAFIFILNLFIFKLC